MSNPFAGGGKVRYIPGKVKSSIEKILPSEEDAVRNLALERDLIAADLLEGDKMLDMLDAAIDDQMKDFQLPGGEAGDAARRLCGSETIDWECYKKAKELLNIAPWIANGYDPVQTVFGDKSTRRAGQVLMNCKDFDPDLFFGNTDITTGVTNSQDSVAGADIDESDQKEDFGAIQKKAQENQKQWALLILFWEYLWGRPDIREEVLKEYASQKESFDALRAKADDLRAKGDIEQANKLSMLLAFDKLPDIIHEGRPRKHHDLMWEAFPPGSGPLDRVTPSGGKDTKFNYSTAAVKLMPLSVFKDEDEYDNKGIPSIKTGFILSLLTGALGLIPKAISLILKIRAKMMEKLKIFKKPIIKVVYKFMRFLTGIIFIIPILINAGFIELIVWLVMKPGGYDVEIGDIPDELKELGADDRQPTIDDKVTTHLEIEETPAGFIPLDCLANAQEIVNKVHGHAVSD